MNIATKLVQYFPQVCITLVVSVLLNDTYAQSPSVGDKLVIRNRLPEELERAQIQSPTLSEILDHLGPNMIGKTQRKSDDGAVDNLSNQRKPGAKKPGGGSDAAALARSAVITACNKAIKALDNYERELFDRKAAASRVRNIEELRSPYLVSHIWNLSDPIERSDYSAYVALISGYDSSCLVDPSSNSTWREDGLDSVVGILSFTNASMGKVRYCTGFRITNTRIATARHCTYYAILSLGPNAFDDRRVSFDLPLINKSALVRGPTCLSGTVPAQLLQPCNKTPDLPSVYAASVLAPPFDDDWDVLDIDDLGVPYPANVTVGEVLKTSDNLIVGGLMLYAGFLSKTASAPAAAPADSWLRVPRAGYCSVVNVNGGCALYGCQTIGGTSGAPLIVANVANRVAITGIHIGSTGDAGIQSGNCQVSQMRVDTVLQGNAGRVLADIIAPFTH